MELKWNEIEPGTYEARVGDWLLEVGRHDEGLPWIVWVGLLSERETRRAEPVCGTMYRRNLRASLDEAQRAAVALAVEKCAPFAATARAEAALAEREACAGVAADICDSDVSGYLSLGARETLDAIRARTTPDTLSTDTLAAIAEARGLRLVEPEYLAELEAAAKSETHRTMCEWCGTPATCIVTSEGDPYALACDEHCGHSAEDAGGRAMLSEPGELLALVNALRDRAEDADKHASAAVMAEREACAAIADARSRWACDNRKTLAARDEDIALAAAIRARSKPETQPEQEQLFDDAAGQALR